MDKRFLIVFVILLAGLGGWWYFSSGSSAPSTSSTQSTTTTQAYGTTTPSGTPVAVTGDTSASVSTNAGTGSAGQGQTTTSNQTNPQKVMQATLHTSMGDITLEFDSAAPQTVANFVKLAQGGFYNGVKFHRVIKGFMDQAGDPLTKDDSQMARWGTGGPGYTIADENQSAHNGAGVVSMANTGQPNSGGSQFFINAVDNSFLDGKYSVFAKVISGMDVVTAINNTPTGAGDRPVTPVVINSVTLN